MVEDGSGCVPSDFHVIKYELMLELMANSSYLFWKIKKNNLPQLNLIKHVAMRRVRVGDL